MNGGDIFAILKARYCLAAIIIAWEWQPGIELLRRLARGGQWYWEDVIFHYYSHAALTLFLFAAAALTHFKTGYVIGRPLLRQDFPPILFVVLLTFCASIAIDTVTMVPVSYVFPDMVSWWLEWAYQPAIYIAQEGTLPLGANILSFVSLVILAPILEECIFRGYLLHRWSKKWGLRAGVVLSSAVFGALHPDALSAAMTGFGFALLYLKTQTLWAAVAAHSTYNFIVWLWDFYGVASQGAAYYKYTIEQFRSDSWLGAVALLVFVLLLDKVLKRKERLGPFVLPAPGA